VYERHQTSGHDLTEVTAVRLAGVPAAPGFGIGRAHLLVPEVSFASIPERRPLAPRKELGRFTAAVARSVEELERLKERVQASYPEIDAALFDKAATNFEQGFSALTTARLRRLAQRWSDSWPLAAFRSLHMRRRPIPLIHVKNIPQKRITCNCNRTRILVLLLRRLSARLNNQDATRRTFSTQRQRETP
jgi:hypothetical protein